MPFDITVYFTDDCSMKISNVENYMVDATTNVLKVQKNNKYIFFNFSKVLYVGETQDLS